MDRVKAALRKGDVLAAYDLALKALDDGPADLELEYLSVLALARSGATRFAEAQYRDLGLDRAVAAGALGMDIGALGGRLAKDRALASADEAERQTHLARAIAAYSDVAARTADPYPLVNVAALRLWAGDAAGSRAAAREVLERLAAAPGVPDYWRLATRAEAHLLAGDLPAARAAIVAAAECSGEGPSRDWQALAVTGGQLRRSCHASGIDPAILAPLAVPQVLVYAGDAADAGLGEAAEAALAGAIAATLQARQAWVGFGGLQPGFEILTAEALVARGAELHVVLPFPAATFEEINLRPAGGHWRERFAACLARASSLRVTADQDTPERVAPVHYARRVAMGHAILRAKPLDTSAVMLAPTMGSGGDTSQDAAVWSKTGRETLAIPCEAKAVQPSATTGSDDCIDAATLIGDFTGFGRLPERLVRAYADRFLGGIGGILDRYGAAVIARNSWGDAVLAQFEDVRLAARCAIDVQSFLGQPQIADFAPGVDMRMRIGLHYGPVQRVFDKVQGRTNYLGAHVVRAARIEPVAIPGMIYVSESFAAALAVGTHDDLVCDYLGILDTAKSFGKMPLYALREVPAMRQA